MAGWWCKVAPSFSTRQYEYKYFINLCWETGLFLHIPSGSSGETQTHMHVQVRASLGVKAQDQQMYTIRSSRG